jgi:hypothetical protein
MVISEHVLITRDNGEASEMNQKEDAAGSLLRAATNGKESWKTFFYKEIALATNVFNPGLFYKQQLFL